jgi:hypothetical protein
MGMRRFLAATAGVVLGWNVFLSSAPPLSPAPRDSEESLLRRIEQQNNPVRKARLEIRLGRLHLEEAVAALERGEIEKVYSHLDRYLEVMQGSWTTLKNSGRQAWRRPAGFKDLDIALRQDERALQDMLRRVPYDYRGPIEEIAAKAEALRAEVLEAIFPREDKRKKKGSAIPNEAPQDAAERVRWA